jgi:dsDNA-binding SOS-regulon protein
MAVGDAAARPARRNERKAYAPKASLLSLHGPPISRAERTLWRKQQDEVVRQLLRKQLDAAAQLQQQQAADSSVHQSEHPPPSTGSAFAIHGTGPARHVERWPKHPRSGDEALQVWRAQLRQILASFSTAQEQAMQAAPTAAAAAKEREGDGHEEDVRVSSDDAEQS